METIRLSETTPLESHDLERLRGHAARVFAELEARLNSELTSRSNPPPPSWVGNEAAPIDGPSTEEEQTKFRRQYFDSNGFWVARGFCDPSETLGLKRAMNESVRRNWFPKGSKGESNSSNDEEQNVTTFGTDAKSNEARGDPFLESADKVSYFAEPTALDSETGSLKPQFLDTNAHDDDIGNETQSKKVLALNKAGHGLHLPPHFRDSSNPNVEEQTNTDIHEPFFQYTTSPKLRNLVLSLGYQDPVVPQSMYIFKNPIVGGAVHSHQDSTFLYTTPRQTCLGLWLALDDATLENGCLWVRPKSHLESLRRQFIRNPKHKMSENGDDNGESKLTFRQHHDNPEVTWEGALPESVEVTSTTESMEETKISSLNFVPVEVKAGDLVLFCGTLDHFSLPNFSDQQRHTFQLHLVEGPGAGVTWSAENWLQYETPSSDSSRSPQGGTKFLRLLDYNK